MMLSLKRIAGVVIFGVAFVFVGCDQGGENAGAPGAGQLSQESLVQLAAADAVDGTTDKVVSNCLRCGLGMAGSPEHIATAGEYKLHLCSAECKADVEKDVAAALATVKIPKENEAK